MPSPGPGVEQRRTAAPPAERACKLCRRASSLRANPYYGAGLAVHEWMYVCPGCGWMEMVHVEAPVVTADRAAEPFSLGRWLSTVVHRRAPSGTTRG